ncbi:MAG: YggT family protein [Acidimicrobiales bacterium]
MIRSILAGVVEAFVVVLVVRALLSWLPMRRGSAFSRIERSLALVTEPVLRPIRRVLPPLRAGGASIDLSFILVVVVAEIVVIPILHR